MDAKSYQDSLESELKEKAERRALKSRHPLGFRKKRKVGSTKKRFNKYKSIKKRKLQKLSRRKNRV